MAIELTCGQCQGRLMAEVAGSIVACPHCGVHLQTPGEAAATAETPSLVTSPPPGPVELPAPVSFLPSAAVVEPPPSWSSPEPAAAVEPPAVLEQVAVDLSSVDVEPAVAVELAVAETPQAAAPVPAIEQPATIALAGSVEIPPPVPEVAPTSLFSTEFAAQPPTFEPLDATVSVPLAELEAAAKLELQAAPHELRPEASPGAEPPIPRLEFPAESTAPPPAVSSDAVTMALTSPFTAPTELPQTPLNEDITQTIDIPESAEVDAPAFIASTPAIQPVVTPGIPSPVGVLPPPMTAAATQSAPTPTAPSKPAAAPLETAGVSSTLFMLVVSYASAMTLACGYLLYQSRMSQLYNDQLESLPDYTPKGEGKKKTSLITVPPGTRMNPLHTLKVGESQRYGSVRVTALKVTREPLELVWYHEEDRAKHTPPAKRPVLKLHLRLENVSTDQVFVPLDFDLLYSRLEDPKNLNRYRSSNFVCPVASKGDGGTHVLPYDLPEGSDWDLKDQRLGAKLKPGETLETYIATLEDGIETLVGDLIWRVHFRKGYNPQSRRGVTTLIEVAFNSSEIIDPSATATPPAEPAAPLKTEPAKPATT